jgi:hypothetical protein
MQRGAPLALLFTLSACQSAKTQTHLVLDVDIAQPLAGQVTRLGVYGETLNAERASSENESAAVTFKAGGAKRFILFPESGKDNLQARIIAWQGSNILATVVFRSRYANDAERFLRVRLACKGSYDLGSRAADADPSGAVIDVCGSTPPSAAGAGGGAGHPDAGAAAGGGSGADGTAGAGTTGAGGAGTTGAGSTAGAGGAGGTAGAGGAAAGGGTAGAGGTAGGAGTAGAGGAALGGTTGGTSSGAGGVSGSGGTAGRATGDCFGWSPTIPMSDLETLDPPPYVAAKETRPDTYVNQYICLAKQPPDLPTLQIGKGSIWGCYVPNPGANPYKVPQAQVMTISSSSTTCLSWDQKLDPSRGPSGSLAFGDPPTHVCFVRHNGEGTDTMGNPVYTSGPRIGQVQLMGGVWVCQYEFYGDTLHNQPDEDTRVLDLAP